MARKTKGVVVEHVGRDGLTYRSLRFQMAGKRRFAALGAVSVTEAERALRHTLADVERGVWQPPRPVAAAIEPEPLPTFHTFAESWWTREHARWRASTCQDYRWRLERHLLPYFADDKLDAITVARVEDYIAAKLAEDEPLSPRSINMTLVLLGAILESAVDRDLIVRNVARGKRRRVRELAPRRAYLDSAEAIEALLDAAGRLDASAVVQTGHRRALIATLVFAGLRIGEALALRWADVDLARGTLTVNASKTDAGRRTVNLVPVLHAELRGYRARGVTDGDALVFGTSTGKPRHRSQVRALILAKAVEKANEQLRSDGRELLPTGLTPHSLRRTFASLLFAIGETPPYVMAQMGHTTPTLTLAIYARQMDRRDGEPDRLRALVTGDQVAVGGSRGHTGVTAEIGARRG
jgi:integrase